MEACASVSAALPCYEKWRIVKGTLLEDCRGADERRRALDGRLGAEGVEVDCDEADARPTEADCDESLCVGLLVSLPARRMQENLDAHPRARAPPCRRTRPRLRDSRRTSRTRGRRAANARRVVCSNPISDVSTQACKTHPLRRRTSSTLPPSSFPNLVPSTTLSATTAPQPPS